LGLATLVAFCAVSTSTAADATLWVDDFAAAAQQARTQSKLLLVVDVADDFLAGTAQSPQAQLYSALATSDSRVAKLLADRFVCTFRAVGRPESIQFVPPVKEAAGSRPATGSRAKKTEVVPPPLPVEEFALAYVCLPGERVLHFIPGFVTADELLLELEWADAANRDRLQAPPTEKLWFIRQRHLAAARPNHREPFAKRYESKWLEDARAPLAQKPHDLLAAIRTARDIRDAALLARLKSNWPATVDRQMLLEALASHAALEPALAHLVLAEFPLPPLAELERTLFEVASGGHYWRESPRREALQSWWTEHGQAGAHRLLVVADHPIYADYVQAAEPLKWPPTSPDVKPHLVHFAAQHLTLDELAQLSADANLEPIRFQAADGPPRYLIYDSRGFRIVEISAREGTTKRLAQALAAVVSSGDLAASVRAKGGSSDEPK
jgi:hypothetical protein